MVGLLSRLPAEARVPVSFFEANGVCARPGLTLPIATAGLDSAAEGWSGLGIDELGVGLGAVESDVEIRLAL